MSPTSRGVILALILITTAPLGAHGKTAASNPTSQQPVLASSDDESTTREELTLGGSGLDVTSLDTRQMLAPAVVIRFRLDHSQPMRLEILDRHARLVRTLAQGLWAAGGHSLAWHQEDEDGILVETGIYYARLSPEVDEGVDLAFTQQR